MCLPAKPTSAGTSKTVIFIRHAESRWNRAKRNKNVVQMFARRDHPLTPTGYAQALALAAAVGAASGAGAPLSTEQASAVSNLPALAAIGGAQVVWASPLTRAVQTALVGLAPLLSRDGGPQLLLKPIIRERKNLFGKDTLGVARGVGCGERALGELRKLGMSDSDADAVQGVLARSDASEASARWWTRTRDRNADVERRADALLAAIEATPHETIVVVGHSLLLRVVFRRCQMSSLPDGDGAPASLRVEKLPNCGAACCTIAFDGGGDGGATITRAAVVDVRPLMTAGGGGAKAHRSRKSSSRVAPA